MEKSQNPIVTTLRWLVFIPGGIIGGGIAGTLLFLICGAGNWLAGVRFDAPITIFTASFGSGWATVAAGAWIAPSGRKTVPAVVVAVSMLILAAGSILIRISREEWFRTIEGLCLIAGTVASMKATIDKEKNSDERNSYLPAQVTASEPHSER